MATATCLGCTLLGVEGQLVEVQVDLRGGLPGLDIVGLPDRAVSEAARRVRAAIRNSGFSLPPRRITVNLAPADVPKQGAGLDLAIAAALLTAAGCVPGRRTQGYGFWGQLSLDGSVLPAPGVLPAALALKRSGRVHGLLTAPADATVAARSGMQVFGLTSLRGLASEDWPPPSCTAPPALPPCTAPPALLPCTAPPALPPCATLQRHLQPHPHPQLHPQLQPQSGEQPQLMPAAAPHHQAGGAYAQLVNSERCYRTVLGQPGAVRALLLAAAGEHSALFLGPPGIGKTLLARAVHALLPPLGQDEALETAAIISAAGQSPSITAAAPFLPGTHPVDMAGAGWGVRPVRTPSSRIGSRAMFGGGQPAMIGEITLSHRGVLVMDEMHQYRPDILAGLAAVMEAGEVAVRCRGRDLRLPARALVVGTSNLCPCGRTGAVSGGCACTPAAKRAFWTRLSGPLLDRIDLQVEMSDVTASDLAASAVSASGGAPEATSDSPDDPLRQARECVRRARARQEAKFGPGMSNGFADEESFRSKMRVESSARDMLQEAQAVLGLSARAYFRTLRVAATAADLAGRDTVSVDEVAEALAYRSRLRPLT